jgi:hypothetical protein
MGQKADVFLVFHSVGVHQFTIDHPKNRTPGGHKEPRTRFRIVDTPDGGHDIERVGNSIPERVAEAMDAAVEIVAASSEPLGTNGLKEALKDRGSGPAPSSPHSPSFGRKIRRGCDRARDRSSARTGSTGRGGRGKPSDQPTPTDPEPTPGTYRFNRPYDPVPFYRTGVRGRLICGPPSGNRPRPTGQTPRLMYGSIAKGSVRRYTEWEANSPSRESGSDSGPPSGLSGRRSFPFGSTLGGFGSTVFRSSFFGGGSLGSMSPPLTQERADSDVLQLLYDGLHDLAHLLLRDVEQGGDLANRHSLLNEQCENDLLPLRELARGTPRPPGQFLENGLTNAIEAGTELPEDLRGHTVPFADQAEKDVLSPDVVVVELERFAERQLDDLLGAWRERDMPRGGGLALSDGLLDLPTDCFEGDVQRLEGFRRHSIALMDQTQQHVLSPDVVVIEHPRFFLGEDHHALRSVGESLEQRTPFDLMLVVQRSPDRKGWPYAGDGGGSWCKRPCNRLSSSEDAPSGRL